MMRKCPFWVALSLMTVTLPSQVAADPISIVRYDITNAAVSGTGVWAHVYTGTITSAGSFDGIQLANYSGGGGTLNDGVIGSTHVTTQLFAVEPNPVITLFFNRLYSLTSLTIFGGDDRANLIPGALMDSVMVTAGGLNAAIPLIPFGFPTQPNNERLQLIGTGLDSLLVDRIALSGFRSSFFDRNNLSYFSIAEVRLEGAAAAPVPEPGTFILLGTGVACAITRMRQRSGRTNGTNA